MGGWPSRRGSIQPRSIFIMATRDYEDLYLRLKKSHHDLQKKSTEQEATLKRYVPYSHAAGCSFSVPVFGLGAPHCAAPTVRRASLLLPRRAQAKYWILTYRFGSYRC